MSESKNKKPSNRSGWVMLVSVVILYAASASGNGADA